MKKGVIRYNWIHRRKCIATWTVLILILSFISLSAAESGNETDSLKSTEINLNSQNVTDKDPYNGETIVGSTEITTRTGNGIDNQEASEEDQERILEASDNKDSPEGIGEKLESVKGSNESASSGENTGNGVETKTVTEKDTDSQESIEKNLEIHTGAKEDTSSLKNIQENPKTKVGAEKSTDNQESNEENLDTETGANDIKDYQESAGENSETKTRAEEYTDNQENAGNDLKTGKIEDYSIDNLQSSDRKSEQKEETKEYSESQGSSKTNLKLKTSADYQKDSSENSSTKTETKIKSCDWSKKLKIIKLKYEPEGKVCSGIESSRSGGTKPEAKIEACNNEKSPETERTEPEIKIGGINWKYIPGTKELKPEIETDLCETDLCETDLWSSTPVERLGTKELKPEVETGLLSSFPVERLIETEESSWNNLKFILSYPCSLRSFYTTHESVKINYKGSEALKGQKVEIYLVKTCNSSSSEGAVKNVTDSSAAHFEDFFNKNTEFYIQIPTTLNEYGDLSPLTLGPLPEGSYWVLVTLAGNETKTPEPEKTILLANYFEVLRYEMEAEAPHTLEAGKNFEVNLSLKNTTVQENCTYWAVLIREDACKTNTSTGDINGTKAVSGTFVQELRLLRDFGFNSTNYEYETGKDELKSKIETLIGQGNGTISIGEENQSTLSLKSLGLAPGNYLLFAGAYEKEKGLAGMAQKKLTISPAQNEDSDLKSYSGDYNFSGITSKGQSILLSVS